jgi:hypothetical protein
MIYEATLGCDRPLHPPDRNEACIAGLLATNKQIYSETRDLLYKHNTFHFELYPFQIDHSDLYKITRLSSTSTSRMIIASVNEIGGTQRGADIPLWSLLPYCIRLLPQRLFCYSVTTLAGRSKRHVADELRNCKNLKVLELSWPIPPRETWSRFKHFEQHFQGQHAYQLYSQILNRSKGRIVWRRVDARDDRSFIFRLRGTADFTFDEYIVKNVLKVLFRMSLDKVTWMRQEGSGSWQAPLGTLGFVQVRGKIEWRPEGTVDSVEFNAWVLKERLDGPKMEMFTVIHT